MSKTTESFEKKKNTKKGQSGLVKKTLFLNCPSIFLFAIYITYPPGEDLNRLHLGGLGEAGVGSLQGSMSHFEYCIHSHGE